MTRANLRVLVLATDGSDDALLARRAVADLAVATGAAVHVLGAWNVLEADVRGIVDGERRALLDAGVSKVETHVPRGRPADAIVRLADDVDADLTVLGSRGHGPLARLVLGSVAETVVLAGHRPVLVMRGGDAVWPPPRIIAGCDGSRESLVSARLAATVASVCAAPLVLLDVTPGREVTSHTLTFGEVVEGRRGLLERWAQRLTPPGGPRVRVSVTTGDPAAALLAAAGEEPQGTVAVGRRGIGRSRHARLGRVTITVLHGATGPVLVGPWSPLRPRAGTDVEASGEIPSAHPGTCVLLLTSVADVDALTSSIMSGASGFVVRRLRGADLPEALREVATGRPMVESELTPQERRVLELVGEGLTNRQIGGRMGLAEKTVKNYVSNVLSKLGLTRRTHAVAYLARHWRPRV